MKYKSVLNPNQLIINSGFISPNNFQYQVNPENIKSFCEDICFKFCKQSDSNQQIFNNFAKQYQLYDCCYDFVMFKLKWIHVGSLLNSKMYSYQLNKTLVFSEIEQSTNSQDLYHELKLNPIITNAYRVHPCHDNYLSYQMDCDNISKEGIIAPNGSYLSIENFGRHRALNMTVLNQILLNSKKVLSDYNGYQNQTLDKPLFYLVYRLGYIEIVNCNPLFPIYNRKIITPVQEEFLRNHVDEAHLKYIDNEVEQMIDIGYNNFVSETKNVQGTLKK